MGLWASLATFLVVAIAYLSTAQHTMPSIDPSPIRVGGNIAICAGQPYDFNRHRCCNYQIVDLPAAISPVVGFYFACCGTSVVDLRTEMCCAGRGVPLPTGTVPGAARCCGVEAYDQMKSACCSGAVTPLPSGITARQASCCAVEAFNNITHGCCSGSVFERRSEMCCNGMLATNGGAATHVCCGIESYPRHGNEMCCDGQVADGRLENGWKCCGADSWHPLRRETRCCDMRETYDPLDSMCCGGVVLDLPELRFSCCGMSVMPRTASTDIMCCNGRVALNGPGYKCCGHRSYDPRTAACCPDTKRLVPAVAGGKETTLKGCNTPSQRVRGRNFDQQYRV